jgi:hypothetical protein
MDLWTEAHDSAILSMRGVMEQKPEIVSAQEIACWAYWKSSL